MEIKQFGEFPCLKIEMLPNFHFMFFDRYEIHIQAFVHSINENELFFDPHLHKTISRICIQNSTQKNGKTETHTHTQHK